MRTLTIILLFTTALATSGFQCNKEKYKKISECIKGRLEIKGICLNYVIKVLEGDIDTSKITSWKDPQTGTDYQNVFALGSPCTFPADIKEGDEFYFHLIENINQDCAICEAYRPVPDKKNMISVSKTPCL